jgi:hypothetical protein
MFSLRSTKLPLKLYASHNNTSSIWKTKIRRKLPLQKRAPLILSIPNYLSSRQGKSLDWKWASILDKIAQKGQRGILDRNSSPIIKAILTVVGWPHIATNHRGSCHCTVAFENLLQSIIQIKGYQIWNEGVF